MAEQETGAFPGSEVVAEVAVAAPVEGSFYYLLPVELIDTIQVGHRVLVPFGRRKVTGYILNCLPLAEAPPIKSRFKKIEALLDTEPLFEGHLLTLFRFAAQYYHYPLGQVVTESLPAGLKVMSRKTVFLTPSGRRLLDRGLFDPAIKVLLQRLNRPSGIPLTRLVKEDGVKLNLLGRLESQGLIKVETRLNPQRVRPKTEKWLHPAGHDLGAVRLGIREKELLKLLIEQGPLAAGDLRPSFPQLSPLMNRLRDKGLIEIEERVVYRDALGRAVHFEHQPLEPTAQQALAITEIARALDSGRYTPFLLHGVTGSGKTEVYLAAAALCLAKGRTALFLVPEISLTPAMEGLLRVRFKEQVAVLHSGLSEGERYDQWLRIRRGEVRLVLGARSAVFAPLADLGLIVVDEEHDGAYKQEDKLRYQARDLAVFRAREAEALVILGSATPSLESFYAARTGRYRLLSLTERIGSGQLPGVDVVDMRLSASRRRTALTPILKKALQEVLDHEQQALLFINRRGLAGLPLCLSCGHVVKCFNCSVTLTLHQASHLNSKKQFLSCHTCGFEDQPPRRCPACGSRLFNYLGLGTEKMEEKVAEAFPQARVGRLDADTARPKGELSRIIRSLRDRDLDILVGTQMITKGHDFPGITLVGVVEADLGLHLPDFRAGEKTFQLLTQVSGRAGRGRNPGRVIVQTYSPEHYALLLARRHDYLGFFEQELEQRREAAYPPFTRLVLAVFRGNSEERTCRSAELAAELAASLLARKGFSELDLLGPAPAPVSKIKGKFRYQLLMRSTRVKPLHIFLTDWLEQVRARLKGRGVELTVDVDPYQMM